MNKKTKDLKLIKINKFQKFFLPKYDMKKYWKCLVSFILNFLKIRQFSEKIGIYQIGDVVVDLYEDNNRYYGTIFAEVYIWEFGLKKPTVSIYNKYEIAEIACDFGGYYNSSNRGIDVPDWAPNAEIASAISNASWWVEEVVELEELPNWCYEISID